jgi:hypothetical protein
VKPLLSALLLETKVENSEALGEVLAETYEHLQPEEAKQARAEAVQGLISRLDLEDRSNPNHNHSPLHDRLTGLLEFMEPEEANHICAPPIQKLVVGLHKHVQAKEYAKIAPYPIINLTRHLSQKYRRQIWHQLTEILLPVLEQQENLDNTIAITEALSEVAPELEKEIATRIYRAHVKNLFADRKSFTESTDGNRLAHSFVKVAGRLQADEAASICTRAAHILISAIEKENTPESRNALVFDLITVADYLEPAVAASLCRSVLPRLVYGAVNVDGGKMWEMYEGDYLDSVNGILRFLEYEETHPIALNFASKLCCAGVVRSNLVDGGPEWYVDKLLTNCSRFDFNTRSRMSATLFGLTCTTTLNSLAAVPAAGQPLPCRLSTPELVELLKMPTCWGETRKVVLKHLGNRYGRAFANHWEFVRYAEENQLGLDFTTPPKRPSRP